MPEPLFTPPRFIALEGPIRVGKFTLARMLAEELHARRIFRLRRQSLSLRFLQREARLGISHADVFPVGTPPRLSEVRRDETTGPVISDFIFEKDKIFAYINLDNEELRLYEKYFDMLAATAPVPDLVIYLQAKPEVLQTRLSKKNMPDERDIAPEYLATVAQAYEHYFFRYSASNLLVVGYFGDGFCGAQRRFARAAHAPTAAGEGHAVLSATGPGLIYFPAILSEDACPEIQGTFAMRRAVRGDSPRARRPAQPRYPRMGISSA